MTSRLTHTVLLFALLGCSPSAPKPAAQVPGQAKSLAVAAPPAVAAPVVLEQVPAPTDLFVWGYAKSPSKLLQQGGDWVHVPVPWQQFMNQEAPALLNVIDDMAPAFVAVTLDPDAFGAPKPLFAFSIGLKDFDLTLDELRNRGRQLERLASGVHFVRFSSDFRCLVARANGSAPGRLICGEDRKALDALGGYMARTQPTEALQAADLHLELRAAPLRKRFGKKAQIIKVGVPLFLREIALGNARFDAAASDGAHAVADELLRVMEELDVVTIDGLLNVGQERLELRVGVELIEKNSFTSAALKDAAKGSQPAPSFFWQLPLDVGSAGYSSERVNVQRYEPLTENLVELLSGALEHIGLSGRVSAQWVAAYRELHALTGATVYGSGAVPEAKSQANDPGAALAQAFGYHILGIDEDAGRYRNFVDRTVAAFNDRKLRAFAEKEGAPELKYVPRISKRVTPGSAGLPKGSVTYQLKLTSQALQKLSDGKFTGSSAITGTLVVVPVGQRTWIGVSTDEKSLYGKLVSTLKSKGSTSLETRVGLEEFRSVAAVSAVFVTLKSSLEMIGATQDGSQRRAVDVKSALLGMPNKGQTPIVLRTLAHEDGPRWSSHVLVPKAALEDFAAMVVGLAAAR